MAETQVLVQELLEAKFEPDELRTDYRGMTYVEDERVMDRLTFVLGPENWHIAEAVAVSDRVVRLTIAVRWPGTTEWLTYSDFGYPNKADSQEPLKEAWTDAFRRVGRLVGIARYIYLGEAEAPRTTEVHQTQGQARTPSVQPPADAPAAAPSPQPAAPAATDAGGTCPVHGWTWSVQKGGVSAKTQKAYGPFYKCGGKTDGRYCTEKPSDEWVKAHPIAS